MRIEGSIVRVAARCVIGALLALATHPADAAESSGSTASHQLFSGVWQIESPAYAVRTATGEEPPLQPAAAKVYQQHIAARKQGDTSFDGATWCASLGMPRLMFVNSPFEIMVGPKHVAFMHEWYWWARIVYLPGGFKETVRPKQAHTGLSGLAPIENVLTPGPIGLSLGKWIDDTLVIKTDHLIETTLIDSAGLPHSDALKLTETLRLRSPDVLEDRIRFEDPETFTRPWETVVTYRRKPGARIHEDVCPDRIKDGEPAVKE
jgi:hypothetical protein